MSILMLLTMPDNLLQCFLHNGHSCRKWRKLCQLWYAQSPSISLGEQVQPLFNISDSQSRLLQEGYVDVLIVLLEL